MFTNSRYRMHGVSLHNMCMVYNMNGCIPILCVCVVLLLSMIMSGIDVEYDDWVDMPLLNVLI